MSTSRRPTSGIRIGGYAAECPRCGSVDVRVFLTAIGGAFRLRCGGCGHAASRSAFRRAATPYEREKDRAPLIQGRRMPILFED